MAEVYLTDPDVTSMMDYSRAEYLMGYSREDFERAIRALEETHDLLSRQRGWMRGGYGRLGKDRLDPWDLADLKKAGKVPDACCIVGGICYSAEASLSDAILMLAERACLQAKNRLGYPGSITYIADFNDRFARDKRQVLRVIRVAKDVLREWMEEGVA